MAVIKVGDSNTEASLGFGVLSALDTNAAVTTTGYSLTTNQEAKEIRNKQGNVAAVAFHKKKDDISVDFIGAPSNAHHVGVVLNAAYHGQESISNHECYVDEVTVDIFNEGHRTTSIKASGYYPAG